MGSLPSCGRSIIFVNTSSCRADASTTIGNSTRCPSVTVMEIGNSEKSTPSTALPPRLETSKTVFGATVCDKLNATKVSVADKTGFVTVALCGKGNAVTVWVAVNVWLSVTAVILKTNALVSCTKGSTTLAFNCSGLTTIAAGPLICSQRTLGARSGSVTLADKATTTPLSPYSFSFTASQ